MKQFIENKQKEEGGFTLVELLVVILIIGILAAIAIPAFLNQRQRANDSAVESDVKNVATQIESALVGDPNATVGGSTDSDGTFTVELNGDAVDESHNLSDGVSVTVTAGTEAGTYTIDGWHVNGKEYTDASNALTYDSVGGGLQGNSGGGGSED